MSEKIVRNLTGKVINAARDKTVTVAIEWWVKHRYGKIVKRFTKYHAHDDANQYKVGDLVIITESKPISKSKAWIVQALSAHK